MKSSETTRIVSGDNTVFNPRNQTISWNEYGATVQDDNKKDTDNMRSPANNLYHEVAHAVNYIRDPWGTLQRSKREAGVYDNQEERNVISTVESNWANEMGEPVRTNHYGKFVPGVDPTEFVNKKMD
jgi:hypothetical protein